MICSVQNELKGREKNAWWKGSQEIVAGLLRTAKADRWEWQFKDRGAIRDIQEGKKSVRLDNKFSISVLWNSEE